MGTVVQAEEECCLLAGSSELAQPAFLSNEGASARVLPLIVGWALTTSIVNQAMPP